MWSSSKLVRATTKMSLPNECWMHVKFKSNDVLQHDERIFDRKEIFHAPDFSLDPLINHVHTEMLGVRIREQMEAMSDLFGLNEGVEFYKKR